MKLLFAADLHMDPLIWKELPDVRDDAHESWKQIVAEACSRKVDTVVLGGDVFDTHPPSESVRCFLDGISRLRETCIRVLAIQGQHGYSHRLPWSSIDPYVEDLNAIPFAEFPSSSICIAGIDNLPPMQLQERLKALDPKVNVLVLHQMIKGMVPSFGGREIWNCDPDWIPSHVKLVLAGDYHSPVSATFRGIRFMYNGSTVLRKIDEPDEKFFHIVNEDLCVDPVKITTRPIKRVLLTKERLLDEDLAEFKTLLAQQPAGAVVYLKHNPKIPDLPSLCREIHPNLHYIFRPLVMRAENLTETAGESQESSPVTLRGCLNSLLDRDKAPFLYDFICALLDAESPADTIAVYKHKFLEEKDADVQPVGNPELLSAQRADG